MNEAQWERLRELFEAALERHPGERIKWAQSICGADTAMFGELCRLLNHHDLAGTFLTPLPASALHVFTVGQVVAERFEITGFLGCGGMGEVYAAQDRSLGTPLAIKTLRSEISWDRRQLDRLLREIQLARQVTHPGVCRVFDLEQHSSAQGEIAFLTMELIVGETLAERIARMGAMPAREALAIATQIASALDGAHRSGVIHRDLKPANVMLTAKPGEELRAVVMDFGLARRSDPEGLDRSTELFGTAAYMAPELLQGGQPTPASDIYAFGVLVCEMVTARKPGAGAEIPALWNAVIRRCLDPDPNRRFQTAAEAIDALRPMRRFATVPRSMFLSVGAALLIVALLIVGLRGNLWKQKIPEGTIVMLADVANSTGDPTLDGLGESLRSQLRQSARFDLWDDSRRVALFRQIALPDGTALSGDHARQIALREGVPFVLSAGVAPVGDRLVLSLTLERIDSRSIFTRGLWTHNATVDSKEALSVALHDAAGWFRATVGENPSEIGSHDRLPLDVTTSSWEAWSLYAQADHEKSRDAPELAVTLLRKAVSLDPWFALAHMRLADLLMTLRRQREGLHEWAAASESASKRLLTQREELHIHGLYSLEIHDYSSAEAAFSQMENEYPRDYLASFYLADALRWQGKLDQAATKFALASNKNPSSVAALSNLAGVLLLSGHSSELESLLARRESAGQGELAAHHRGMLAFTQNRFSDAEAAFRRESTSASPDRASRGQMSLAALLAETGRFTEARSILNEGVTTDRNTGRPAMLGEKLLMLASLDLRDGDRASMKSRCIEAVQLDGGPQQLRRAGSLLARAGFLSDAARMHRDLEDFPDGPLLIAARNRIAGEIELQQRHFAKAVEAFRIAAEQESPLQPRHYLGRALAAAGDPDRAIPLLRGIAENPALFWQTSTSEDPGMLTDNLLDLAEAARRVGDTALRDRAMSLFALRRPGDSGAALNRGQYRRLNSPNKKEKQ